MDFICPYWAILIFNVVRQIVGGEQYEVSGIFCSDGDSRGHGQRLEAKLKKPDSFRGYPFFADDRRAQPSTDPHCQIRPIGDDPSGHAYSLLVKDFKKCGVGDQNGFTTVRVWFPTLPGLILMTDQEVVIACRPTLSTVTENRAAGFSGSIPQKGRVSGVVQEGSARPEYAVAVYREATARSGNFVMQVDQAVPIGTRLQLKAAITTNSVWKYAKLVEVTVSTDPNNAYQPGFIFLIQEGCRNQEYHSIVPQQPVRALEQPGEVNMEFEAFLLESMAAIDVLWIHTRIKACIKAVDCAPTRCVDLTNPVGFGRRKRHVVESNVTATEKPSIDNVTTANKKQEKTDLTQNVGIKIIPTSDFFSTGQLNDIPHCNFLLVITIVVGSLLMTSIITVIILACRIHAYKGEDKLGATHFGTSNWRYLQSRYPIRNRMSVINSDPMPARK